MTKSATAYVPWRDRAFLNIREASQIMSRSPDWVRNRIGEGRLIGRQLLPGGPVVVVVSSLIDFIEGVEAMPAAQPKTTKLYLAIDNG